MKASRSIASLCQVSLLIIGFRGRAFTCRVWLRYWCTGFRIRPGPDIDGCGGARETQGQR